MENVVETESEIIKEIGVPASKINDGQPVRIVENVPKNCVEALRHVAAFVDLPDEQLKWFIENSEEMSFEPGEFIFRVGDPADWMVVYLEGEIHLRWNEDSLDGEVYVVRAGDPATEVSGKLPFSRMKKIEANGRVITKTRLLRFSTDLFPELLQRMPVLAERLVWILSDRVRETTKMDERRDKLMALGKLSAGLAHELNNPAAAARRTSDEMMETLKELREADLNLCRHNLTHEQRAFLADFEQDAIETNHSASTKLNALALSDLEDKLTDWLEDHGVQESWNIASSLVEAGIDTEKLIKIGDKVPVESLKDVLTRLSVQISVAKLASEIKTSVTRISDLVGAIKEYSYMDQAAVQKVDLHKGLENTLLILKYKLKKKNIEVTRDFADNLPHLTVHGSLLNQVWTNLIDNAIDAMSDGGKLKIKTRLEPESVLVEIRDNGAGIPPDVQSHIFEPFFTTKGVNEGTGLGLDTVSRIISKHHGNLRFETKPGDTCFQVRLPLQ